MFVDAECGVLLPVDLHDFAVFCGFEFWVSLSFCVLITVWWL